ncbi:MAG: zinc-ribbon domain-containing protein [Methanobrevibacter sp.]|uniref:zinc-ribbon domain-containing protein n=1 Tax=Methanobrevibacter sp. TaxID=66852 RepID=UPI0025FEF534|nr:zinc ribbon domain-containing protein [Methanobrevibacter sp.]MBR0270718.1 zinc-ribbon domain-containing protein [Methanobrevibacter sp.]
MKAERCPNCNKIISPHERICSNCGEKLNNQTINKMNNIYHRSNVATLWFFLFFLLWAIIFAFSNWIYATIITAILVVLLIYYKNRK